MSNTYTETVTIQNVIVVDERPKAIDCRGADAHIAHWIARGQLQPGTTVEHESDRGTVVIPRWLAERAQLLRPEAQANG
jgi:hypothetical protein